MSEKGGGFQFGNIGGNVSQTAGGDIIGGDKTTTTTTTTTTTIQKGFADEEKKDQFHSEIEQLREACESGRVAKLPGFGETTQAKICTAIEQRAKLRRHRRVPRDAVGDHAEAKHALLGAVDRDQAPAIGME